MAKTILVVDDSSSLRALVKLSLTRAGHSVLEAADGKQALAQVEQAGKVHLVVSDVNMPVIMLTTEDEAAKMQQAKAAGARAWLLKPFDPPSLLDAVARVILP